MRCGPSKVYLVLTNCGIASRWMPLSRRLAIPSGLTIVGIGLLLVFLGLSLVQNARTLVAAIPSHSCLSSHRESASGSSGWSSCSLPSGRSRKKADLSPVEGGLSSRNETFCLVGVHSLLAQVGANG